MPLDLLGLDSPLLRDDRVRGREDMEDPSSSSPSWTDWPRPVATLGGGRDAGMTRMIAVQDLP